MLTRLEPSFCTVIQIMLSNIGQKAFSVTQRAAPQSSTRTVAKAVSKARGSVSARTVSSLASSRSSFSKLTSVSRVRLP